MMLYAAADMPLPEIAETDPPGPFSARRIDADEHAVRAHLTQPHVYFLGSCTGCSCGFSFGNGGDEDADGRVSVEALGTYIVEAVARAGAIQLYACWDGDEAEPLEQAVMVTTDAFDGDAEAFALPERWLATVSAPAMPGERS